MAEKSQRVLEVDVMFCDTCGGRTRVLETRDNVRLRHCTGCDDKFWTEEMRSDWVAVPGRGEKVQPRASRRRNWNNPFNIDV